VAGEDSQGCILVADDDTELQTLVARLAAAHGYTVIQALDGERALAEIALRRPDLILLDLMMPRLDGRDVLRRLKADPDTATIPVIVYSARGEHSDRLLGLELGADDYIEKPFNADMLMRRISHRIWKSKQ
jgi:DNA-binding response OmpR family regulator